MDEFLDDFKSMKDIFQIDLNESIRSIKNPEERKI
jgi:hypothetical protein